MSNEFDASSESTVINRHFKAEDRREEERYREGEGRSLREFRGDSRGGSSEDGQTAGDGHHLRQGDPGGPGVLASGTDLISS